MKRMLNIVLGFTFGYLLSALFISRSLAQTFGTILIFVAICVAFVLSAIICLKK
jgi:hypothetical protein